MGNVLFCAGRIGNDQEAVFRQPGDDKIVDDPGILVQHEGVFAAADRLTGRIIRAGAGDKACRLSSVDCDMHHVGNVEQPGLFACVLVFLHDAEGIKQRHLVTGERSEFCACFSVLGIKRCFLQCLSAWLTQGCTPGPGATYPSVLGLRDSRAANSLAYALTPSAQACLPVFQSVLPLTVLLPERLWAFSPSAAAFAALSRQQPGICRMTPKTYLSFPVWQDSLRLVEVLPEKAGKVTLFEGLPGKCPAESHVCAVRSWIRHLMSGKLQHFRP